MNLENDNIKGFSVVNRALPSLHGGSLEITLTISSREYPLNETQEFTFGGL